MCIRDSSSLATSDGSNFNTGPSAKLLSVPKYPAVCSRATASVDVAQYTGADAPCRGDLMSAHCTG